MQACLKLSRMIDEVTSRIGRSAIWLVLFAVLISAINALVRKLFDVSSNAFLELQWYLFSATFLLAGAYTLLRNEHVRIDILSGRLSARAQNWIDIFGLLFFLLPMAGLIMWLSWPVFLDALRSGEVSSNAGGLIIWPARLLVPFGFALLILQAFSELIKRFAFLRGIAPNPLEKEGEKSAEEELAETLRRRHGLDQDAGGQA